MICDQGPSVIVSSRNPGDLPAFCRALTERFASHTVRKPVGAG
jgi:hypothetical protein